MICRESLLIIINGNYVKLRTRPLMKITRNYIKLRRRPLMTISAAQAHIKTRQANQIASHAHKAAPALPQA